MELSREEAHAPMARFLPDRVVARTLDVLEHAAAGRAADQPDVETVLHRPAAPFATWAGRTLPALR